MTTTPLVPGRECGACNARCEWLLVDTPEFRKPPSNLCRHAGASGCRIHPDWPPICRDWFCGWRSTQVFPDDWRPDRCGIIVMVKNDGIPDDYDPRPGLHLLIFRPIAMVLTPSFVSRLSGLLANRTLVFLAVPGSPGSNAAQVFANTLLDAANSAGDVEGFVALLTAIVNGPEDADFQTARFENGGLRSG